MKNLFYTAMVALFSVSVFANNQTYYVDSDIGKDANPGTFRAKPWASLDKVNSITFEPGDRILFKAGSVYKGQLKLKNSGEKNNPIVIDSYGAG